MKIDIPATKEPYDAVADLSYRLNFPFKSKHRRLTWVPKMSLLDVPLSLVAVYSDVDI